MSFDPFASSSEPPSEYGPPSVPPGDTSHARQRVQAPAIALIIVGILNLLMALVQVGGTILIVAAPEQIQKMMEEMKKDAAASPNPSLKEIFEAQDVRQIGGPASVIQNIMLSLVMVLIVVLNLLGGLCMHALKSYAFSIAGAISAAIPCLSCGGCCCFGEIIGIWALIVLLNEEVRAAFH